MLALDGLPSSWESFIQGISARSKLPKFDRLKTDCIQEVSGLAARVWIFCSLNAGALTFMIPIGFGAAVSTQVSNELGVGNSHSAHVAVYEVFFVAIVDRVMTGCLFFSIRKVWGYAYGNEKKVIYYDASMIPLVAASSFLDGIQGTLSGKKC
ncbi:protein DETOXIFICATION 17 [Cryptomeria japonica]|uniref:protein DETOXIFICATION 17 n=1 Tax=Cryptomeria japonica TaxID=3369 RepID=UPI0025AC9217|nr:protein DETOXIFICATION 17 [Cryptomeria japonica]